MSNSHHCRPTSTLTVLCILSACTAACVDRTGEDGLLLPNARVELSDAQDELWEIFDDPALDTGYVHCTTYYNGGLRITARKSGGPTADGVSLWLRDMPPLVSDELDYTPDATELLGIGVRLGTSYSYVAGCVQDAGAQACSHCSLDATTLETASPDDWIVVNVQCENLWPKSSSDDYPWEPSTPWPHVDLNVRVTCILSSDPG